jgi:sugar phosphate permease
MSSKLADPQEYPVYMRLPNLSESTVVDSFFRDHDSQISTKNEKGEKEEEPPVDDVRLNSGFTAWSQVFVSFLLVFNGFGYFSSFGLFQTHWTEFLNSTQADIAWVGSLSLFLLFFLGTLSGPLMDRGHFRSLLAVGCGFQILGAFSTSAVSTYWQLILAQGVVQGIGNGMLFTPCIALVSVYFTKNRAFALSLAACGAPIGGIVFPLVGSSPFARYCTLGTYANPVCGRSPCNFPTRSVIPGPSGSWDSSWLSTHSSSLL